MKIIQFDAHINRAARPDPIWGVCRRPMLFVLQKLADPNDGTSHYDLRLEFEGCFKSWVIPQGPSLHPQEARLAVRIEDAPMACVDFEGVVPPDEFGGGAVLIWDSGEWEPKGDPHSAFNDGPLQFSLKGRKLQGDWLLARLERPFSPARTWRLSKLWDRAAAAAHNGDILAMRPESVLTGRRIEHIISEVW